MKGWGIQNNKIIGDGDLTSSTALVGHEAWRGRLNGSGSWRPEESDRAPVYKVAFNSPVKITYIATQGAPDVNCLVTSLTLQYEMEQDKDFKHYPQVCHKLINNTGK